MRFATHATQPPSPGWRHDAGLGGVALAEVIRQVRPTILIGTSARRGAFSEAIVTDMAAHAVRPVIMAMSNPTSLAEARPADLIRWTQGRALVATGSPFDPVDHAGTRYIIAQANNALIFPGLGLGVIAAAATRITDGMLSAAAYAVAGLVDTATPGVPLLPQVAALRDTSLVVAAAVAQAAADDGVAARPLEGDVLEQVRALMWQPVYRPVLPA
ncbi:MAG: malic enzyme-like NAD(P)-binding protein [Streptosporangiaceae bacterium]